MALCSHFLDQPLSSKQYRVTKRYDILNIGDSQKQIESGDKDDFNIRCFYRANELYDVLETV